MSAPVTFSVKNSEATTCGSTGCFQRPILFPFAFLGSFASLAVGLILDALLFGMPDFGLFMAAFPDEVALFGYQSYHYLW